MATRTSQPTAGRPPWFERIASNRYCVVIVWGLFIATGLLALKLGYSAHDNYWQWHFGQFAPVTEAALLLLCVLTSYLVRYVLFPEEPERTRCWKFFWISAGIVTLLPLCFTVLVSMGFFYRYPVRVYYPLWATSMVPVTCLTFEVTYAIFASYQPRNLKAFRTEKDFEKLYQRLQNDTNALIWMYGLFAYFLLGFFADVFFIPTQAMTYVVIAAFASILFVPWLWSQAYVKGELQKLLEKEHKKVDLLRKEIEIRPKSTSYDRLRHAEDEIERLEKLQMQFALKDWILTRRRDLLPVVGLNLITPFMNSSLALKLLHKIL